MRLEGERFGVLPAAPDDFQCLERVWINRYSLRMLQETTKGTSVRKGTLGEHGASFFTFVDCASFSPFGAPALSYSKRGGRVGFLHSLALLGQYLLFNPFGKKKDVHSGYFDFDPTRRLIYGIAAFGMSGLDARSDPPLQIGALAARTRIKIQPSAYVRPFSPGPMDLS